MKTAFLFIATCIVITCTFHDVFAQNLREPRQTPSYSGFNVSNVLDSVLRNYDKRVRPNYGEGPVEVGLTMYILGISDVSEVEMDYTMDFYFRQFWHDERLEIPKDKWDSQLSVGTEVIDKIWIPDTFFANEKKAYYHQATTQNSFLRINHEGQILRSMRLTVTASCFMDLRYFPMDSQICTLEMESFGHSAKDIIYKWKKGRNSVGIDSHVKLPNFYVRDFRLISTSVELSSGNYSRLAVEIDFHRDMGYYIIQVYIPSGLIVMISWVSFWLNRNANAARVSLGVTTVLTMTTLMTSTNAALPKVSYVKSIDVYLGTCFVLVFAALIEYAAVGYLDKHQSQEQSQIEQKEREISREILGREDHAVTPSDVDKYSRLAFPIFFLCFNLLYWIIYQHISNNPMPDAIPLTDDS